MSNKSEFGIQFETLLDNIGISKAELARRTGLDRSNFTNWCKPVLEVNSPPSRESLDIVSAKLDLKVDVLRDMAIAQWPEKRFNYLSDEEQEKAGKFAKIDVAQSIQKPDIPKPDTSIYFPLRLAKEVKEKVENRDGRHEVFIPDYPGWVEQEEKWRNRLEIKAANEVLDELLETTGLHVIVGEPGGGKTTLLRNLGRNLQNGANVLPLYVPFRSVKNENIKTYFETWKDTLTPYDVIPYLLDSFPKGVKVVWLFDGWDELAAEYQEEWTSFIEQQQEQHVCILTCRTAQYSESDFGKPYFLMGLYPDEQKEFLQDLAESWQKGDKPDQNFSHVPDDWVTKLHSELQNSEQLRFLAGSPLLLTLIAKTNSPLQGIDLPLKRVEFYQKAFRSLIEQRNKTLKASSQKVIKLKKFLAQLSYETNQDGIRAEFPAETFFNLAEQCGLTDEDTGLLVDESSIIKILDERCQWLHLTFAEWLLAEAWKEQKLSLLDAIKQYWQHPDYDEALALYWSSACFEEHTEAIQYLVKAGVASSKKESSKSRSALKVLVQLYSRSGIEHSEKLFEMIWSYFNSYIMRRFALSKAKSLSSGFLEKLASDKNPDVRWSITERDTLPDSLIEKLASDEDSDVRWSIIERDNLPNSLIEKLVNDKDSEVRTRIKVHSNLAERVIEKLASDENSDVRFNIAWRQSLSDSLIEKLASDADSDVRMTIAGHKSLPNSIIERLASDQVPYIRWHITHYKNLPDSIIKQLANDEDSFVRQGVANRDNLPDSIIEKLICDEDSDVRWSIILRNKPSDLQLKNLANNESLALRMKVAECDTLPDLVLDTLATDKNPNVRKIIAKRDNLSDSLIEKLSSDEDSDVRSNIAERESLSGSVIEKLASDKDSNIRRKIACLTTLPDSLIEKLANDEDSNVRRVIAEHNSLSDSLIEKLANDENSFVRVSIAERDMLHNSIMEKLSSDEDSFVRWQIASHPDVCWEWLAN